MEGLGRWNADRVESAISDDTPGPDTYSGSLMKAANDLSVSLFGKKIKREKEVGVYTGELIGVEYLFSQTGKVLESITNDDEEMDIGTQRLSDIEQGECVDEGFEDEEDETVGFASDVFGNEEGTHRANVQKPIPISSIFQ